MDTYSFLSHAFHTMDGTDTELHFVEGVSRSGAAQGDLDINQNGPFDDQTSARDRVICLHISHQRQRQHFDGRGLVGKPILYSVPAAGRQGGVSV